MDIEAINDRIQTGDKDALKELDDLGISYTLTEDSSGGYIVDYSYGGKNYSVRYYAPPSYEDEQLFVDSMISQFVEKFDTLGLEFKDKLTSVEEKPINEPDDQVNALMSKFISEFKSNEMISNDYGYQLSENLRNFDDYIRENMETAYIEYLEKSD